MGDSGKLTENASQIFWTNHLFGRQGPVAFALMISAGQCRGLLSHSVDLHEVGLEGQHPELVAGHMGTLGLIRSPVDVLDLGIVDCGELLGIAEFRLELAAFADVERGVLE